jgi:hypothetical protein
VFARLVGAQQVAGTVRDSATQRALPGTSVLILDATGRAAARGMTDQSGRFRLMASSARAPRRPAPRLRLRILRMGFRPFEQPLTGATSGSIDVALVSFPILLDQVEIKERPGCPARPDRATALALLQQVRAALFANVVARSQNTATMTRLLYQRRIDAPTGRTLGQTVRSRVTSATSEPFNAERSATAFDRLGFVEDATGVAAYFGPDAETLIDDAFSHRYCFLTAASDRSRPVQVGLSFEAPDREEGRIDVVGTLWVDTLSRVLKDLSFRYVGLDRETSVLAPEGRLSFRELSNGVVIIDRWSIRLTGERSRTVATAPSGPGVLVAGTARSRAQEIGGEVARAVWPNGFSWRAPLGALRVRVLDDAGRPVPSSLVQLADTEYQGTTDVDGVVELDELLPGPYVASTRDPRLAELGLPATSTVRVNALRDSTVEARLEVETAEAFVTRRCGQTPLAAGKARLLGRVLASDGRPLRDARWTMRDEFGALLVESGRVDEDALFHACQLPANRSVTIEVRRGDRRTTVSRVTSERLTTIRVVLPN